MSAGSVEQDEVFEEIQKILFAADSQEHRFQIDRSLVFLFQPFPFVEKFIFAAKRAYLRFEAVGKHHEGVEMEDLRDRLLIIRVVHRVGVLHIHVLLLQLHEQQRNAVDKSDDIGPATIQIPVDLHFLDRKKMILFRFVEIEDPCITLFPLAIFLAVFHLDPPAKHPILVFVRLDQRGGGRNGGEGLDS